MQFLTKQTAALKEVNESRVKIYEQIEISLSELETNNLRLSEDSAVEKSKIKRFSVFSFGLTIMFVFQSAVGGPACIHQYSIVIGGQ